LAKKRFAFKGDRLRALPSPQAGRIYYYDDRVRGLALEVTANGARSFRVYRKFKGSPVKITLGTFDENMPETRDLPDGAQPLDLLGNFPSLNVRMAQKLALAVVAELDTGINPVGEIIKARKGLTLGKLFERYRTFLTTQRKKAVPLLVWTWERYLGALPDGERKKHGAERKKAPGSVNWEKKHLGEITHEQVTDLCTTLGEKVGRTTGNRVVGLLRAMFNFAKRKRLYMGENPAEGIDVFELASRERFLQVHEAQKFFGALEEEHDSNFRDYVKLLLYSGARRGNLLRMRWDELSLEGAQWTVSGEKMKNGDPLTVPLVKDAIEILQRRVSNSDGSPWVFPGNTASGHAGPHRKKWAAFVKKAGVSDLRVHDLRRSLGSWMASGGSNTVLTMRALGHKTVSAALIYQRLATDPVRNEMQKAVTAMTEAAKKKSASVVAIQRKKTR
jgi:integrase